MTATVLDVAVIVGCWMVACLAVAAILGRSLRRQTAAEHARTADDVKRRALRYRDLHDGRQNGQQNARQGVRR